ncbi:MAG: hypothetical protein ABIF06_02520 [bacterium]
MEEEFYHKNIFGELIDLNMSAEEEAPTVGVKTRPDFNIFSLTDAFGARQKKKAWVLYQRALASGISAEEIFWKLAWQTKTLLITLKTKNMSETEMKPFPYNKAKSLLKYWKAGELEDLSERLVVGYHKTRLGEEEMGTFIEKTLLSL